MQNKKRLHRLLLLIYIIYFAALIVGFAASFVPDFSRGWRDAQDTLEIEIPQGGIRSYYVSAPVVRKAAEPVDDAETGKAEHFFEQVADECQHEDAYDEYHDEAQHGGLSRAILFDLLLGLRGRAPISHRRGRYENSS